MKIPLVNEQDEIIEYKDKNEIIPSDIFRVSCLWITDPEGLILLAKRALIKKYDPGLWGAGVVGTVEEQETYESNIIKEAEEELGLKNIIPQAGPVIRVFNKSHNYFAKIFFSELPKGYNKFTLPPEEVAQAKWFTLEEIHKIFDSNPNLFVSSFKVMLDAIENYADKN